MLQLDKYWKFILSVPRKEKIIKPEETENMLKSIQLFPSWAVNWKLVITHLGRWLTFYEQNYHKMLKQ